MGLLVNCVSPLILTRFDHPDILAGQGTMGLEILEQVPDLDAAVIPVGGGGLIAGVAKAIKTMKPGVKIIVIQKLCAMEYFCSLMYNKKFIISFL